MIYIPFWLKCLALFAFRLHFLVFVKIKMNWRFLVAATLLFAWGIDLPEARKLWLVRCRVSVVAGWLLRKDARGLCRCSPPRQWSGQNSTLRYSPTRHLWERSDNAVDKASNECMIMYLNLGQPHWPWRIQSGMAPLTARTGLLCLAVRVTYS